MNRKLVVQLIALFFVTQLIGLIVGFELIREKNSGLLEQPAIVNQNPNDVINSIALIAYILVFTGVLLLIIKFFRQFIALIFKVFESLVIFGTTNIVLLAVINLFFPSIVLPLGGLEILAVGVLAVFIRLVWKKSILLRNITSVIAAAGAGALIGITLGIIPVVLFVAALAVYDLIAVFKTKHMVTLAKEITSKNLSFTFALPTKEHTFELGTGDMVIPLTLTVSVLEASLSKLSFPGSIFAPSLVLCGSLVGLLLTIDYSSKHVGKALPALPPQTILMLAMIALSAALGFSVF